MKNNQPAPSWDASASLRVYLKQHTDLGNEIARIDRLSTEFTTEHQALIASGRLEDIEVINKAATLQVKLSMLPHRRRQLEDFEPPIADRIMREAKCLAAIMDKALDETLKAIFENIRASVAHLAKGEDAVNYMANHAFSNSDAARTFLQWRGLGTDAAPSVDTANYWLECYEQFRRALVRFKDLLPDGFAPFPKTEDEFSKVVPPHLLSKHVAPPETNAVYNFGGVAGVATEDEVAHFEKHQDERRREREEEAAAK